MVIWVIKTFFVLVFCVSLPPLLNTSVSFRSILFLSFIVPIFSPPFPLVSLIILSHSIVFLYFFAFFHLKRLSYLSLLFSGTLHSNGSIFPFLFCLLLPFFSQLFASPPQTTICLFAFLFLGDGLDPCLLYNVLNPSP